MKAVLETPKRSFNIEDHRVRARTLIPLVLQLVSFYELPSVNSFSNPSLLCLDLNISFSLNYQIVFIFSCNETFAIPFYFVTLKIHRPAASNVTPTLTLSPTSRWTFNHLTYEVYEKFIKIFFKKKPGYKYEKVDRKMDR